MCVFLLIFIFEMKRLKPKKKDFLKKFAVSLAIPLGIALVWIALLTAVYGFRFSTLAETNHENIEKIESHMDNISRITSWVPWMTEPAQNAYKNLHVPFPEYIQGFIENVIFHNTYGHDTFLFGMYSKLGWWYYFPLNMLVKMPIPALIGIGALFTYGVILLIRFIKECKSAKDRKKFLLKRLTLKPYHIFIIVPVFLLLLSMKSNINLGMRHILVVLPFIYLGIGLLVEKLWDKKLLYKIVTIILGCWYILSALFIYPHYLEYFNELVGGPENGYKYLLDSNLSWSQDKLYLYDYIADVHPEIEIHLNPQEIVEDGIIIIEADMLMGMDSKKRENTAWIREPFLAGEWETIDRIAYTYFVFDARDQPTSL